jgi:hypothetical protein
MRSIDELKTTIRRNKLLGMWAAEKLNLGGRDAEVYADALAMGTVDPECSDVARTSTLRGVVQSDDVILRVMRWSKPRTKWKEREEMRPMPLRYCSRATSCRDKVELWIFLSSPPRAFLGAGSTGLF